MQLYNNNDKMFNQEGALRLGIKAQRRIEKEERRKEAEVIHNN